MVGSARALQRAASVCAARCRCRDRIGRRDRSGGGLCRGLLDLVGALGWSILVSGMFCGLSAFWSDLPLGAILSTSLALQYFLICTSVIFLAFCSASVASAAGSVSSSFGRTANATSSSAGSSSSSAGDGVSVCSSLTIGLAFATFLLDFEAGSRIGFVTRADRELKVRVGCELPVKVLFEDLRREGGILKG